MITSRAVKFVTQKTKAGPGLMHKAVAVRDTSGGGKVASLNYWNWLRHQLSLDGSEQVVIYADSSSARVCLLYYFVLRGQNDLQ